jgi:phospholipid-transporting ATPase
MEEQTQRTVFTNNPEKNAEFEYPPNITKTHRYTPWNFIFKNLYEQFRRLANFYFLIVAIIQSTPISPLTPITSILPLVIVISISALKDAVEDWRRRKEDDEANNKSVRILRGDGFQTVPTKELLVGDIVKIKDGEEITADILPLSTSNPGGICSVETSNLDGETTRKIKMCVPSTSELLSEDELRGIKARISCDAPNPMLESFSGKYISIDDNTTHPLSAKNILLRGSSLKNTHVVHGLVLFTGPETKLALNQKDAPSKMTHVESRLNRYVIYVFIVLMALCLAGAVFSYFWVINDGKKAKYLLLKVDLKNVLFYIAMEFLTFFVLLNVFIPISLYVSVEMCKVAITAFMQNDLDLYCEKTEKRLTVKTINMLEELGQVTHLFTDKTGTLTENKMVFKYCSVDGKKYYSSRMVDIDETEPSDKTEIKTSREVDENDLGVASDKSMLIVSHDEIDLAEDESLNDEKVQEFLLALSLANTIYVEHNEEGEEEYQSSSPDEEALIKAAKAYEYKLISRSNDAIEVEVRGEKKKFELLSTIEFSSTRKRMSVIVKTPEGEIKLYTKGADSEIFKALNAADANQLVDTTRQHIDQYSNRGFRVLCVACKTLDESTFNEWNQRYQEALTAVNQREKKVEKVASLIETDLSLLGATVIEDRLQEGVPDALRDFSKAFIRVWVLTGDKVETAISVARSANLIMDDTKTMVIKAPVAWTRKDKQPIAFLDPDETRFDEQMMECHQQAKACKEQEQHVVLVIDGDSLTHALDNHRLRFLELSLDCDVVICCRVSPIQKAEVVKLVKDGVPSAVTLAIGDGGNDVAMIQEAHVGVGLMGREGSQASRASDFACARFKFLKKLMFVHGRYSYIRITKLIQYYFYKNIAFTLPQFYFAFYNGFSGQSLYDAWIITFYNMIFTSLPILMFAIFNKDVDVDSLMKFPQLYSRSRRNLDYNFKTFLIWVADAVWASVVVYFGTMWTFGEGIFLFNGQTFDLYTFGLLACCVCIAIVLIKMAIETNHWTWLHYLCFFWTLIGDFAVLFPYCLLLALQPQMYWIMFMNAQSPITWLGFIILVSIAIFPYFAAKWIRNYFWPEDWQIIRERKYKRRNMEYEHVTENTSLLSRSYDDTYDSIDKYIN